jgi:hypothetical protein
VVTLPHEHLLVDLVAPYFTERSEILHATFSTMLELTSGAGA